MVLRFIMAAFFLLPLARAEDNLPYLKVTDPEDIALAFEGSCTKENLVKFLKQRIRYINSYDQKLKVGIDLYLDTTAKFIEVLNWDKKEGGTIKTFYTLHYTRGQYSTNSGQVDEFDFMSYTHYDQDCNVMRPTLPAKQIAHRKHNSDTTVSIVR